MNSFALFYYALDLFFACTFPVATREERHMIRHSNFPSWWHKSSGRRKRHALRMRAAHAARKISPTSLPRFISLSHHRRDSISSRVLVGNPSLAENDIKPALWPLSICSHSYFCSSQKHANFARPRFTRERIFVCNFRALTWKSEDEIAEPWQWRDHLFRRFSILSRLCWIIHKNS